jgi:DNA-binding transcriptional regulator LsrR (DeoR family)
VFYNKESEGDMSQEVLRDRLLKFIYVEGVNQKHISKQTRINEGLLSRYKNEKCNLGMFDRESLDAYLVSKGY